MDSIFSKLHMITKRFLVRAPMTCVEEQKRYLLSFPEPISDVERSYFQYKCQRQLLGSFYSIMADFISIFFVIYYISKSYIGKNEVELKEKADVICFLDGLPQNIIPSELSAKYKDWNYAEKKGWNLNKSDRLFFFKIVKKYPFSWYFLFKCLVKIGYYSYVMKLYCPDVIVVANEYSFTSSVLTSYCNQHHILHINVMHGDKLYFIRDSFFRFDSCYIWDSWYMNLFCELRAEEKQFLIARPPSMQKFEGIFRANSFDYTYYLGGETKKEIPIIIDCLMKLKLRKKRIKIRPHPRYTDMKLIKSIESFIFVENPKKITIEESILSTKHAIALYSTVLQQAYYNGISVVIDDISNPLMFRRLKDLKYVMLQKEHQLLSEIIR